MRLLVLFDLPVISKEERKVYRSFRKFLIKDGYDMLQFSVYCRICNGEDGIEKHLRRLNANLPSKGAVRVLQLTDRQYANMKFLVGEPTIKEKKVYSKQMNLF